MTNKDSLEAALAQSREAHAIRRQLADSDPTNASRQLELANSHNVLGNILHAKGEFREALKEFEASVDILARVSAAHAQVQPLQLALVTSHKNVGESLMALGDIGKALQSYRVGLTIAERLVPTSPGSVELLSEIAAFHARIGEVQRRLGDVDAALASYLACQKVSEACAKLDASNSEWRGKLSWLKQQIDQAAITQQIISQNFAMLCQYAEANLARATPGQTLQIALPQGWSDAMEKNFRSWCAQKNFVVAQILPGNTHALVQRGR
jgi:tetratricopeptide (TPR) repeat protein